MRKWIKLPCPWRGPIWQRPSLPGDIMLWSYFKSGSGKSGGDPRKPRIPENVMTLRNDSAGYTVSRRCCWSKNSVRLLISWFRQMLFSPNLAGILKRAEAILTQRILIGHEQFSSTHLCAQVAGCEKARLTQFQERRTESGLEIGVIYREAVSQACGR